MIALESDSSGRLYQIWKQDQAASCGVASSWMARGIARQMSYAEDEWDLAQRIYNGAVARALHQQEIAGPQTFDPNAYQSNQTSMGSTFSRFGLFTSQVAVALRNEGLQVEHYSNQGNPISVIDHKISVSKPAIVFVKWNGSGAHFVVVGRAVPNRVSFLDPWDGHVNEQPNNGFYTAKYGSQGFLKEVLYISA